MWLSMHAKQPHLSVQGLPCATFHSGEHDAALYLASVCVTAVW